MEKQYYKLWKKKWLGFIDTLNFLYSCVFATTKHSWFFCSRVNKLSTPRRGLNQRVSQCHRTILGPVKPLLTLPWKLVLVSFSNDSVYWKTFHRFKYMFLLHTILCATLEFRRQKGISYNWPPKSQLMFKTDLNFLNEFLMSKR